MAIEIVDFPMKNGDFPWQNVSSPEGITRFQPLKISFQPFPQSLRDLLGSCVRMRSLCPVHQTLQPWYRENMDFTRPGKQW